MSNKITITTPFSVVEQREEQASATNPTLSWMDFVFTDDRPNENGVGVKADQFNSLINTGVYMPLKVAEGSIAPGHENALPLGVISSLVNKYDETQGSNQIIGKAALWAEERPEDVAQLKSAYAAGEKLQISWELLYSDEEVDDSGTRWLKDPIVRAATVVGLPAYAGRTPVLAVAALDVEGTTDDLEDKVELEELTTKLAEATNSLATLQATVDAQNTELGVLRSYKAEIEQKESQAALLQTRLAAFTEAGLEFSPEDITAKQAHWLQLDEEAFKFLVSELKGIKTATASTENGGSHPTIPAPVGTPSSTKLTADILKSALTSK